MICALLALTTLLQSPPSSSIPPVSGYSVSHNTTGTIEMNFTNSTNFVIKIMPPKVIVVSVSAMNIVGNGRENSVTSELLLISV